MSEAPLVQATPAAPTVPVQPDPVESPAAERARDEMGRFTAQTAEARGLEILKRGIQETRDAARARMGLPPEEKPQDDTPAASEATGEKNPEQSKSTDADREAAFKTLRLDGFTSKALEKLSTDEAIELASHRKQIHADFDKQKARLNELESKLSEAATSTSAQPVKGQAFDMGAVVKPLAEEFGDEAASKFGSVLKAVTDIFETKLSEQQGYIATLAQGMFETEHERAWTRIAGRYPESEESDRQKVRSKAEQLFHGGTYPSLSEAYSDASRIVLGDGTPTKSAPNHHARTNGTPSSASKASKTVSATREDRITAWLGHRSRGLPDSEAKRLSGLS